MNRYRYSILCFLILASIMPLATFAQPYTLLEDLGFGKTVQIGPETGGFGTYLSGIFRLTFRVAAILAVIMIAYAGMQYMLSSIPGVKSGAKERIGAAIGGLVLALASVLILQTINPNLINFPLRIPPVKIATSTGPTNPGTQERGTTGCTVSSFGVYDTCAFTDVRGGFTCAIEKGSSDWFELSDSSCVGEPTAQQKATRSYKCCGHVQPKNGCSGTGIKAGHQQCRWSPDTQGNSCLDEAMGPNWRAVLSAYCTGESGGTITQLGEPECCSLQSSEF